jgi:hypothetical protein
MAAGPSLYVYALVAGRPRRPVGPGLAGERLRVVALAGLHAVVGAMRRRPRPSPAALRRHDEVVRRLAAGGAGVLPVRFGTLLAGEEDLARVLALRTPELRQTLDLVSGCQQMTLRVYGSPLIGPEAAAPAGAARSGMGRDRPGTRYLARRLRAHQVPELAPLRRALAPVVRAERVERHDRPPLLASVYHLVPRDRTERYLAIVATAGCCLPGLTVRTSGPWPPWAFAPEGVA